MQGRFEQPVNKQLISTLLFTSIGVAAAKKLGIEIVLHTDEYGVRLFECIPYNNMYLTLEGHDINRQFWASGKMLALAKEPLGSCHLDLDAWIKFTICRDIILGSNADLIIQSLEESRDTYERIKEFVFTNINTPVFVDLKRANNFKAYNCGLVKINNQMLKNKWINAYWKIIEQLNSKKPPGLEDKYCVPDLVSEQWLVFQLCEQNNFKVELLCDGWYSQERAKKIGYTHLISEQKYNIDDELKRVLLKLDESLFHKVMKKIDDLR